MKVAFAVSAVCLLALSSVASAKAVLEYPLVFEKRNAPRGYTYLPLSSLNSKLKAKGMKTFPDRVKISSDKQAIAVLGEYSDYTDKVATALGMEELALTQYSMHAVTGSTLAKPLCYTGKPAEVIDLIGSLADSAFSDQQGMIGYRYKDETFLDPDLDLSDEQVAEFFPEIWKKWRGSGEAILFLWHETDDGDDVNEAIIPLCR